MCGIAGIYFKKHINQKLLRKFDHMVKNKQQKRGPDEFNKMEINPKLFFFHNMLSIIDIGNAQQPMHDDKGVLTFNGEVYNYRNLRYSSESYTKNSDTEVLLKGLNIEYLNFLNRTNSMFGFGYLSKEKQLLTIARDRIGIKPLYYIDTPDVFAFASTITPLVIFSNKRLNHTKLWKYYLNRAFEAPETIFDDIREIPAGSYLEFDTKTGNIIKSGKWWERRKLENIYKDEHSTIERIEELLIDAIKNRLVADVPVGLFLSGGVDSSLIAALTSKQISNLNAFTVSFHDKKFDESIYAKAVCNTFGIKYNEIKVHSNDFVDNIDNWIAVQDDIVADPSALLLYKLSEYANSLNYRVLLAGEGADELFGGYNSYKYFSWSKRIYTLTKNLPLNSSKIFFKNDSKKYHFVKNSTNRPEFYGTAMIFEPHLLSELIPASKTQRPSTVYNLKSAMDLDIKDRLPNDVLTRSDRSTSGSCVELRVPFLAHQLVDFSASIDSSLLMKHKMPKYLIKKLASKHFDKKLVYRKKVGFDLPLQSWIRHELKDLLSDTIASSTQTDHINMDVVRKCFHLHLNKSMDHSDKLWAFLCLELSHKYLCEI